MYSNNVAGSPSLDSDTILSRFLLAAVVPAIATAQESEPTLLPGSASSLN
ncbi:hypothetical protein ABFT80_23350 [Mesorhizobium sp. SB112]